MAANVTPSSNTTLPEWLLKVSCSLGASSKAGSQISSQLSNPQTILSTYSIDPSCLHCIFSICCQNPDPLQDGRYDMVRSDDENKKCLPVRASTGGADSNLECHTRKIKCIMPDEGGACRACKSTSRNCYFLPRQKCGRVPRKQNDKQHPLRSAASSESPPIDSSNNSSNNNNNNNNNIHNAFQPADPAGMLTAFTQFESSYLNPSAARMGDPSFMNESMGGFSFLNSTSDKYLTPSDHSSHTSLSSSANNDSAHLVSTTKPHTNTQNSDRQILQARPNGSSLVSKAHHKLSIRLLHECHQIQTQSEIFSSTGIATDGMAIIPGAVIQNTISGVDTICHGILEVSGNKIKEGANLASLSDSRLISVTMAATFTVLEVCEVLAANPTSASQGPDYTLMWKRLDLNLTQLRVALQGMLKIGGPFSPVIKQAITRAKILDNRIKSSVQDAYSDWEDAS